MKNTRKWAGAAALVITTTLIAGCGANGDSSGGSGKVLKVAAFEGGYGVQMYKDAAKAFESSHPGVTVKVTTSKTLGAQLTPQFAAGDFPDVVIESGDFTHGVVKDHGVAPIDDLLTTKVPGEDVTVKDKLLDGMVDNLQTNPYGDSDHHLYLAPMNQSPDGLVYNKALLDKNGWKVPTTWDEFFALGDQAKAKGISLFTYPTAGYMDGYFYSLLAELGGPDLLNKVLTFDKDVWKSPEATKAIQLTTKLLTKYTAPQTVGYANDQDFTKNQQSILDGKVLFMPNGTWVVNEMKDAPRTAGFQWAMMPSPAVNAGDPRYVKVFMETGWIPAKAKNKSLALQFLASLYSDKIAKIFVKTGAVMPIKGIKPTGDVGPLYDVFSMPGVSAVAGQFLADAQVPGVDINKALYDTANGVVSGKVTAEQWQATVNEASNKLGASIKH